MSDVWKPFLQERHLSEALGGLLDGFLNYK